MAEGRVAEGRVEVNLLNSLTADDRRSAVKVAWLAGFGECFITDVMEGLVASGCRACAEYYAAKKHLNSQVVALGFVLAGAEHREFVKRAEKDYQAEEGR